MLRVRFGVVTAAILLTHTGWAAAPSCYDGIQNGPESDVDCGGDCPLCEIGQRCHTARDCESGLCDAGHCREQAYTPGTPVPPGYRVATSMRDRAATARIAGAAFLAIGYAAAYTSALVLPGRVSWMYAPAVGPWLSLHNVKPTASKALVVADGVIQDAGAALLIGGIASSGRQLLRTRETLSSSWWFEPEFLPGHLALNISGTF